MARHRDLDRLLSDLRSFLLILDRESLSAAAQAKKKSVAELLCRLQSPPSEDAEYMIMRCLSPSSGTPQGRDNSETRNQDARGGRGCECRPGSTQSSHGGSKAPSASPSPPADDSYEDAEPLGPGGRGGSGGADTDSSHYESYGEDEEDGVPDRAQDRAHYLRWPPAPGPPRAEPPGRPEAQLCGFLWRKRWLGRWAKQLFIVREHALLVRGRTGGARREGGGPRAVADPSVHPPPPPPGFQACRRPAAGAGAGAAGLPRRLQGHGQQEAAARAEGDGAGGRGAGHRLPEPAAGGGLEEGLEVIEEVSSNSPSGLAAHSPPASPPSRLGRAAALRLGSKEEEEQEAAARSPGEDPKGGFLAVRLRGRWQRLWCAVRQGALRMFPEPGGAQRPVCALLLDGCEVTPGATAAAAGSPQRLRIRIAQRGRELALLQTRSEEEREAWLKTLRARGGREPAADSPQAEPPRLGDGSSSPAAGGLLLRRFPTPNAYMDDPSGQPPAPEHVYSNTERLHRLQSLDRAVQGQRKRPVSALPAGACSSTVPSQAAAAAARRGRAGSPQPRRRDFSPAQRTLTLPERKGARDGLDFLIGKRAFPKLEEKVGQLERACRGKSRLKAGSEMNLLAIGKSLKGHIAATASSAASEGSFLSPLLRRTASARSALKRSPSTGVVEKGKVLQQRREWEMKSAK
ncbi:actin filament-associated protein 1-like 2 isoform X2 [Cygnus olor]|uniref:actin filament-associated protein 1-like 2 isoform X2 n=1 Tax=Cygnus olor TaxID=8869 RepID=UPI001ADE2E0E|nr:actin filament-associated protein 1-like 2 isoform X2 [Cygnus olor]